MANLSTIDVYLSAQSLDAEAVRNKTVVVLDVMHTTTTIVLALQNGAKSVIPVANMGEAGRISQTISSENMLLCGEKEGLTIEGFDLGVNPADFTEEIVKGKTLIMNTTNGTKAIAKVMPAKKLVIGSFLNLTPLVELIRTTEEDVIILSSGWSGRLSLEDLLLAGSMMDKLHNGETQQELRDGVVVALGLYQQYKDHLEEIISTSNNAVRLKNLLGDKFDSKWYTQIDICPEIPVFKDGMITFQHDKKPAQ